MAIFVDVESPYSGSNDEEIRMNIRYARACVRDSLLRGEIPFASHLFYTQPGILDDNVSKERIKGIEAGKNMIRKINAITVVYTDRGTSKGMQHGINLALEDKRGIEYRTLGANWEKDFEEHEKKHSHNSVWKEI